ncbi:unnamed protein product [Boreogadus saida]
MLTYFAPQLLKYNNRSIPPCISTIKQLGLLRRPRYIHRGLREKLYYGQPAGFITSIRLVTWRQPAELDAVLA